MTAIAIINSYTAQPLPLHLSTGAIPASAMSGTGRRRPPEGMSEPVRTASCPSSRPAFRHSRQDVDFRRPKRTIRLPPLHNDLHGRDWPSFTMQSCRETDMYCSCQHDARIGRSGFPLLRNDLQGKFWLPQRNNVEKPTCTVAANTTQKVWSSHVPALVCTPFNGGLYIRHRTKMFPAAASTYMFHVTDRHTRERTKWDASKRLAKKPIIRRPQ